MKRCALGLVFSFVLGCGGGDSWRWSAVGDKQGLFGLKGFTPDATPYGVDRAAEPVRLELGSWTPVETPGANATYAVARDGFEHSSSYGIYVRSSPLAPWTLLPGSRALDLEYVARDGQGSVYATTKPMPDQSAAKVYVQIAGSSTWAELAVLPPSTVPPTFSVSSRGEAYAETPDGGFYRLRGAQADLDAHPQARTFDGQGRRYAVPSLGAGTVIQQLSDAGALTEWVDFGGVGTAVMGRLIGFGADDRFYALAASAQDDFGIGDVVAISPDAPAWKLAASSVLQGDGEAGGPPLSLDAYGSAFAPDGSLYFFGCESGCAGDGNAFTLGVYRLVLGGAQ